MNRFLMLLIGLFSVYAAQAERLVSAGGSLTEIIYALGAQHDLVAVDTSSHFPAEARALPDVGYYRALNVEGVLSVSPDKLVVLKGAGPQTVLDQLSSLGLPVLEVNNPKTVKGLITTIEQVADATNTKEAGTQLIQKVNTQLEEVAAKPSIKGKTAVFLMSAGERGLVAAGKNTTPQLIFEQLGFENPFASVDSFKPVSAEALAASQPDIILLASHTSIGTSVEDLCQDPQLALWANQTGCKLFKVDSLKFIGLTPRLPQAMAEAYELMESHAG